MPLFFDTPNYSICMIIDIISKACIVSPNLLAHSIEEDSQVTEMRGMCDMEDITNLVIAFFLLYKS